MKQLTDLNAPSLVVVPYSDIDPKEPTFVRGTHGKIYVVALNPDGGALFPVLKNKTVSRHGWEPARNEALSVIDASRLGIAGIKWSNRRPDAKRHLSAEKNWNL